MKFKSIILDFDGVIIESVDIKTRAFRELFKEYPEHVDEIAEYHLKNGGMSRYEKFSYIYANILKKHLDGEEMKKLGETFSKIVRDEMIACPFVYGAQDFLKKHSKRTMLFIASGTPEDELREIAHARGLSQYFKGIYGTPPSKSEIILRIIKEFGLKKNEVFFVGDSINDYEGARIAGIPFIARLSGAVSSNLLHGCGFASVKDLVELDSFLERTADT